MDVRRSPRVAMILPWIGAGLDRDEAITALRIGQAAPGSAEVGVQWCGVLVILVKVAAGRIGLPHLNHCARYRSAIAVEYPTRDNDALADRLARGLAGQVVVQLRNRPGVERRRKIVKPVRKLNQWLRGSAKARADVVRIQIRRFAFAFPDGHRLRRWPTGNTWSCKRRLCRS